MSEIKPCPFCNAHMWLRDYSPSAAPFEVMGTHLETCPLTGADRHAFKDPDAAIAAWNTRAAPDIAELRDLVKEALSELEQGYVQSAEASLRQALAQHKELDHG